MMPDDVQPVEDTTLDFSKVPPINQRRTVAFINHFLMQTISFLNEFAVNCESRLIQLENKLEKVEASLMILESQLSSIPNVKKEAPIEKTEVDTNIVQESAGQNSSVNITNDTAVDYSPELDKFIKMSKFGVPVQAVKNKMILEGIDPSMLDKYV